MPVVQPCPDPKALRLLQLGMLSEEDVGSLERHLEGCGRCAAYLDAPPAGGDTLLEVLHAPGTLPDSLPVEWPVSDLIERLKDLCPSSAGGEAASFPTRHGASLSARIARYDILAEVGAGGMGKVFRAYDPQLQRLVALKVPLFEGPPEVRSQARRRFLREARAAARVRHPHVCSVYDVGEDDGRPYVVIAFIEGRSLAARLKEGRFEDCRQAVVIARQVAEALQAVHTHGIVHRDLKPGNILLDASGQALLTDFGLASLEDAAEHLTVEGTLVGTPGYMAPEQVDPGEGPAPASDLYSLGVVLYQMLTGQLPFQGTTASLLRQTADRTPPAPAMLRPGLDPSLQAIVLKAMARQPADRYPDAAAFAEALARWLAGQDSGAGPGPGEGESEVTAPRGWRVRPARNGRLRRYGLSLVVGLACLALLAVGYFATRPAGGGPAASRPVLPEAASAVLPLEGRIDVRVWEPGNASRQDLGLRDDLALPLKARDRVRIDVGLNREAFPYLLLVDTAGQVAPLYPWKSGRWDRRQAEGPLRRLSLPQETAPDGAVGSWEVAEGPPGMETVILLAREVPLPREIDLEKLVAGLPPQPRTSRQRLVWFENGAVLREGIDRGFTTFDPRTIEDPVLQTQALLARRLRPHFPYMRAVSYANQPR
jgi:hypothetical protein